MTRVSKLNAKLNITSHDGGSNPRNPYDRFTPDDREKKIVELCVRIYLRMRSKQDGEANREPLLTSCETPSIVSSDPQSESMVSVDAR